MDFSFREDDLEMCRECQRTGHQPTWEQYARQEFCEDDFRWLYDYNDREFPTDKSGYNCDFPGCDDETRKRCSGFCHNSHDDYGNCTLVQYPMRLYYKSADLAVETRRLALGALMADPMLTGEDLDKALSAHAILVPALKSALAAQGFTRKSLHRIYMESGALADEASRCFGINEDDCEDEEDRKGWSELEQKLGFSLEPLCDLSFEAKTGQKFTFTVPSIAALALPMLMKERKVSLNQVRMLPDAVEKILRLEHEPVELARDALGGDLPKTLWQIVD